MANVVLGLPTMGSVEAKTCEAFLKMDRGEHKICPIITEYALIYDARDRIVKKALANPETDYVWFIDSDIVIPKDALEKLIAIDADIVSASYPFKDDFGTVVGDDVTGVGMGCCLIKRSALEKIMDEYKTCFHPMSCIGEDISFCMRAKNLGLNIVLTSAVICKHVGKKVYEVK